MRVLIILKGVQCLCEEFDYLKLVKCFKVIVVIVEVCEYGDLKENVEYYVVCEEQGFIEGCIKQLEGELLYVEIIDIIKLNVGSKVVFGVMVELVDVESDEEKCYQIVGDLEVDIKLGLIVIFLLLVCVLIGKLEGDVVIIDVFVGQCEYEIVSVQYLD